MVDFSSHEDNPYLAHTTLLARFQGTDRDWSPVVDIFRTIMLQSFPNPGTDVTALVPGFA